VRKVREFSYVRIREKIPKSLKWAFRRLGNGLFQVRGAGKAFDYEIEPRWGWEKIYEIFRDLYKVEGKGGKLGIYEWVKGEFLRLYGEVLEEKGYREEENKRGLGRIMIWKYKPHRFLEIPARRYVLGPSEDVLYLNFVLKVLGFDVGEFVEVPANFFKVRYLREGKKIWLLSYLILSGVFGYGEEGFLVNTPFLFEEFVGKIYGGKRIFGKGFIKPDFLLEDGTPLDAKYKERVQRSDIYQAFAYAKILGKNRAILVYPKVKPKVITLGDVSIYLEGVWK
jgi:hypothetical protein